MVRHDAPEVFGAIEQANPYAREVRRRFFDLASKLDADLEGDLPGAAPRAVLEPARQAPSQVAGRDRSLSAQPAPQEFAPEHQEAGEEADPEGFGPHPRTQPAAERHARERRQHGH